MVRRLPEHRARAGSLALAVFIVVVTCWSFPYFEKTRNANEVPRLVQAMALVDVGNFAIDGPIRRRLELGPDVARSPRDGRIYPNKPPGTTLVASAAYVIARAHRGDALDLRAFTWWARLLTGAVPTLLLAWFLLRRLTTSFSRGPAVAAVGVYLLGTPAASYGHLAYGHPLAALALTVGVVITLDAVVQPERFGPRRAMAWAALGGACAASAVTVEYAAAFAGLPLGVAVLARARHRSARAPAVAAVAGALVPIAGLMAYHRAVFGSAFATGYHHVTNAEFAAKHGQGLLGLGLPRADAFYTHVLSPDAGLLWWAPLVPLALYGLAKAATHDDEPTRTLARVFGATFLSYVLITSSLSFEGGWRVGPRYLVAVLPMLAWGWAEALAQLRDRAAWWVPVTALAGYGFVVNVLAANLWPHFDVTNIHHPLPEVLLPLWRDGAEPYSLPALALGWRATPSLIVVSVLGAMVTLTRTIELTPRMLAASAAGLVVAGSLVAATARWPVHPMGARNLAYIRRVWEPPADDPRWPESLRLPPLSSAEVAAARKGPQRPHRPESP